MRLSAGLPATPEADLRKPGTRARLGFSSGVGMVARKRAVVHLGTVGGAA
jgi:hypothetical protein